MLKRAFSRVRRRLSLHNEPGLPALDLRQFEISERLFKGFPFLEPHRGASGICDLHFQDRELRGAIACTPAEATLLHLAALNLKPQKALEIGSYIGWSSAHIASALDNKLTCVDPFLEIGSSLMEETSQCAKQRFLDNMARCGLDQKIKLVCGKSPDILPELVPNGGWDFAFVDGWHLDDQPVRDLIGLLPYLQGEAVIILHDPWIRDVRDGLVLLLLKGFNLYVCDTANYLTFCWRGQLTDGLRKTIAMSKTDRLTSHISKERKAGFGLGLKTLDQLAAAGMATPS